jgi:hypothetical protein
MPHRLTDAVFFRLPDGNIHAKPDAKPPAKQEAR